ncbi:MAG TPA: hypothetical protein VGN40_21660 [Lelliottia sp.]|jgi:hypothetical protein
MENKMTALPVLKIMGHRTAKQVQNHCNNLNRLVALDNSTLTPVEVMWMYAGDTSGVMDSAFIDTASHKALSISAAGYTTVILRPFNIAEIDDCYEFTLTPNATFVVKDDHTISGWGPGYSYLPVPAQENHDVAIIHPGFRAATALRTDHSIFAWGLPSTGGELKISDAQRTDVTDIQMALSMGLLQGSTEPTVSQWGAGSDGSNQTPAEISSRTDIKKILTAGSAQVALTQSGQILEWGSNATFALPAEIVALTDVQDIYISNSAGVALRKTGQLAAWGIPQTGGTLPDDIAALTDVERVIPGYQSFVALRKNGAVVCWGQDFALPPGMTSLTGIVHAVYGLSEKPLPFAYEGCSVLDSNGQVYSWYGPGIEMSVPAGLSNVVALTTNGFYSFAALKSDGSVVAWGTDISGDTSPVDGLLNDVQAIYPITQGYLALKANGTMVAWGNPDIQSDNASIPADLQGLVTYQY